MREICRSCPGLLDGGGGGAREIKRQHVREIKKREREEINRPSHRLTFSLMYLMMRTTVSPARSILSSLADINMLYCAVSLGLSL